MFVPIAALKEAKPLKTVEDCIAALDTHVLPRYENQLSTNVGFTKSECYGVLQSFFAAGRLNPSLTPYEIKKAVKSFMDDRLWISAERFEATAVTPDLDPEIWFSYPLSLQVKDLTHVWKGVILSIYVTSHATAKLLLTDLIRLAKLVMYRTGLKK